jgi:hypothetical protein
MTRIARPLALIMLMVIPGVMLPTAHAADYRGHNLVPALSQRKIDEFGYRLSFRLEDGVEIFSMRATFRITYLYTQQSPQTSGDPDFSRHNMYTFVGFYYGKTMLGRPVIRNVLADYIAFYPKWHDSAGYPHDLLPSLPMLMLNDTIGDGQLAATTIIIDDAAVASHISEFGGTFVFSGLIFVMDDGSEILLSEEDVQVRVEKYNNEVNPNAAALLNAGSVTYTSDTDRFTATLNGVAPWVVAFDAVAAVMLWGSFFVFSTLAVLHANGRIKLPLHRLRRIGSSEEASL